MGSGEARPGAAYRFRSISSIRRERFEHFPTFPPLRSETAWEDASFVPGLLAAYSPKDYDAVVTCSFPFTHWALRRPAQSKPLQIFVTQHRSEDRRVGKGFVSTCRSRWCSNH